MVYIITIVDEKGRRTKIAVDAEIYHTAVLDGEYDEDLRFVLTVPSHLFDFLEKDRKAQDRLAKKEEYYQRFRYRADGILSVEPKETDDATPSAEVQSIRINILARANAILDSCTDTQRRRFFKYFLHSQTMQKIADDENCSRIVVWKSVQAVVKKLQDELQDDYHPAIFF